MCTKESVDEKSCVKTMNRTGAGKTIYTSETIDKKTYREKNVYNRSTRLKYAEKKTTYTTKVDNKSLTGENIKN